MSQILESDLKKISEIIIEITFPNTRGYGGWFKAFPVRFNKEPFQFDFKNEKDIIALIFLATIWNIDRYKWENAVGLVGVLHNENMLNIKEWSSRSFINKLDKKLLENEMNNLIMNNKDLGKRGHLFIKNGADGVFERLYKISCAYDYLKYILKIEDILKGNKPQINLTIFNDFDNEKLKIDSKGRYGKIRKQLLKVKIPLILRELKCAGVIEIDDKYCCVPDTRVREIMAIIGYPQKDNIDINSVIKNSEIISKYFGTYYDLPLFDFYDNCPRTNCKEEKCEIYKYCAQKIK
ncbi:Uncharacterised protein [uncultured archaeon]|nr:Uncharacterised protein [uncultured archaeon]